MAKGANWERQISGILSLWWTGDPDASVFWRTANSGGRATVRTRKGRKTPNHFGDLCAIDPVAQPLLDLFVIEIKRGYNRATVHDLLDRSQKSTAPIHAEWIKKVSETAKIAGVRYWMLIHKRDRREPLILLPDHFVCELEDHVEVCLEELELNDKNMLRLCCPDVHRSYVWMFTLADFLAAVKAKDVIALHEKLRSEKR